MNKTEKKEDGKIKINKKLRFFVVVKNKQINFIFNRIYYLDHSAVRAADADEVMFNVDLNFAHRRERTHRKVAPTRKREREKKKRKKERRFSPVLNLPGT